MEGFLLSFWLDRLFHKDHFSSLGEISSLDPVDIDAGT